MTQTQALIRDLLVIATLLPLFSSVAVISIGKRILGRASAWLATVVMAVGFSCCVYSLVLWLTHEPSTIYWPIPWIPLPGTDAGWLYLGVMVDGLTVVMMTMVTGISTLVHLYSIGYMEGDKRFERFFAYLSLFTFSMLGIVVSNSIMQLFVFWELVGLTSYLLIGFWFEKRGPQLACKKAFVMNRVGDMGFLIGFGILFVKLGGNVLLPAVGGLTGGDGQPVVSMFEAIRQVIEADGYSITNPPMWLTAAGIGLFFGAIGKSAQFPLHTWLPDAMEGPYAGVIDRSLCDDGGGGCVSNRSDLSHSYAGGAPVYRYDWLDHAGYGGVYGFGDDRYQTCACVFNLITAWVHDFGSWSGCLRICSVSPDYTRIFQMLFIPVFGFGD